jgi:hypothetical protein
MTADVDDVFNQMDAGRFMWEFCQWICREGEFEADRFFWHDILANSKLKAFISDSELVLKALVEKDEIYGPFLRRVIDGISNRGFLEADRTGKTSQRDGEEVIEYLITSKLRDNCHKFKEYGTVDIDKDLVKA